VDFAAPVQALIPGAQGRILAVLAETTAELNLRTIARLSGVSLAQASRIMPGLVEIGIVERRDVPPAALFRLVEDHVASRAVLAVARARTTVLGELGSGAAELSPAPISVIVFGSFAQGTARAGSDIDIVVVRPDSVDDDNRNWHADLEGWRRQGRRLTGNPIEVLEVAASEASRLLRSRRPLWSDIRRHGIVVHGRTLDELTGRRSA
jgi:predicted nucleotidyltransferase